MKNSILDCYKPSTVLFLPEVFGVLGEDREDGFDWLLAAFLLAKSRLLVSLSVASSAGVLFSCAATCLPTLVPPTAMPPLEVRNAFT